MPSPPGVCAWPIPRYPGTSIPGPPCVRVRRCLAAATLGQGPHRSEDGHVIGGSYLDGRGRCDRRVAVPPCLHLDLDLHTGVGEAAHEHRGCRPGRAARPGSRSAAARPYRSGLAVRAVCRQLEEYLRRAGLGSRFGQALTRARRFTTATETPARNAPSCRGLPVAARPGAAFRWSPAPASWKRHCLSPASRWPEVETRPAGPMPGRNRGPRTAPSSAVSDRSVPML